MDYQDLEKYLDWTKKKAELKFGALSSPTFPILYNCIYWAFLGDNIGSEEGKHRPILVTKCFPNSPVCTILPLTTKRLNDNKPYHIDLDQLNSTVLVEQMRVIDKIRIDKPYRLNGKILKIAPNDWARINNQINKQYSLSPL